MIHRIRHNGEDVRLVHVRPKHWTVQRRKTSTTVLPDLSTTFRSEPQARLAFDCDACDTDHEIECTACRGLLDAGRPGHDDCSTCDGYGFIPCPTCRPKARSAA